MFRRISSTLAVLLAVAAATLVVSAAPASAGEEEYPPEVDCTVSVSPDDPEAGDEIVISGEHWEAGATVTVLVGGAEVGEATVAEDGTWELEYTIPADAEAGDYAISAEPCETGDVLGTTITVAEPAAAAPGDLPRTGSSTTEPLVRTGAVLLAAGAVLVYAVRRRNQSLAS